MKEILLEELKQIEFQLLKDFKIICEDHSFNYSILGGTLLGAVRHKGFIPWDDDIDVMMPRPDFERFKVYCINNEVPFALLCNDIFSEYGYMFAKIMNPKTVIIEENTNRYGLEQGIYIDIFIYDGMGNDEKTAKRRFNQSALLRELLVACNWNHYFKSKTHSILYEPARFLLYIISRPFKFRWLINHIEMKYKKVDFYQSEYVGNLCSDRRDKSVIKRSCFDKYVNMEFEGEMFKALVGYETYLKAMYGDYMKLPPEDKRVSHHAFNAYWKN